MNEAIYHRFSRFWLPPSLWLLLAIGSVQWSLHRMTTHRQAATLRTPASALNASCQTSQAKSERAGSN